MLSVMWRPIVLLLATLAVVQCSREAPTNRVCTAVAVAALDVTVVAANSGAAPSSAIAAVVRDGTYRDSVAYPAAPRSGPVHLYLAYARPGTYSLLLSAAGYRDWTRDSIVVAGDECGHPRTVAVPVSLAPSAGGALRH